jgi:hypothetical protein
MESATGDGPGLEYVVERLAACTEMLSELDDAPETPERTLLRRELKDVQRRLLGAVCAFGPANATWLAR